MRAFEKITALLVIIVTYVLQYVKADCPSGTYGNDGNCKICPPNYYCPGNTAQPFQCPPGYTSFDGEASCYEMTHSELEYRLNRNLFSCGSQYGYYCSGSSSVECSAGYYCPANGAQYACPQGNYCPLAGGTASIPSGMYSNSGDSDFHVCPRGNYCNGGSYRYKTSHKVFDCLVMYLSAKITSFRLELKFKKIKCLILELIKKN